MTRFAAGERKGVRHVQKPDVDAVESQLDQDSPAGFVFRVKKTLFGLSIEVGSNQ